MSTPYESQLDVMRQQCYQTYRDCLVRMAELSLAELASVALQVPGTAYIALDWSDQGDWLTPHYFLDAQYNPCGGPDDEDLLMDVPIDLSPTNESVWSAYATEEPRSEPFAPFGFTVLIDVHKFLSEYEGDVPLPV